MKLIYIKFDDHSSGGGWQEVTDYDNQEIEILKAEAVGWVVKEDEKVLVLAAMQGGGEINAVMHILKSCIIKRRNINV